ncbi:MAG: hypothetical protein ACEQSX_13210 [Baekduiaceae bacterium]
MLHILRRSRPFIVTLVLAFVAASPAYATVSWRPVAEPPNCMRGLDDVIALPVGGVPPRDLEFWGEDLSSVGTLPLGLLLGCPDVDGTGRGAVAAVAPVMRPVGAEMAVAVRDVPGGTVETARGNFGTEAAVAVSPSGDVVAAWIESRERKGAPDRARVMVVRRSPGAPFGQVEALTPWFLADLVAATVAMDVGIDAAGTATVAWVRGDEDQAELDGREPGPDQAFAVSAPRGGAFTPPSRVASVRMLQMGLALGVASDGSRTLVLPDDGRIVVLDAPPGGAFGAPQRIRARQPGPVSVRIADGGAGAITWYTGIAENVISLYGAVRSGRGPFRARRRLDTYRLAQSFQDDEFASFGAFVRTFSYSGNLIDLEGGPSIALGEGGRLTVAFVGTVCPCPSGDTVPVAKTSRGSVSGGLGTPELVGSGVRPAAGAVPFASGAVGLADSDGGWAAPGIEVPFGASRIGVDRPDTAPPLRARVDVRVDDVARSAFRDGPLRLRVRCSAPCDVRATVRGRVEPLAVGTASVNEGDRPFSVRVWPGEAGLPSRPRILVRATPAGAAGPVTTTEVAAGLNRRRTPSSIRILGAVAKRNGDDVQVTFRTSAPLPFGIVIVGYDSERTAVGIPSADRTRFAATLPAPPPNATRRPVVIQIAWGDDHERTARVPVSG